MESRPSGRASFKRLLLFTALAALGASTLLFFKQKDSQGSAAANAKSSPHEVLRSKLVLREGLYFNGESNLFSGSVIERYETGILKSRSGVSNGLPHGVSEGWFTNGQLQITERYVAGIAQGERTKFYPNGRRLSRVAILDGQVHGIFQQWHSNGTLAVAANFDHGTPNGLSEAWFPDGSPKSRVMMDHGRIVEQKFWDRPQVALAEK